MRLFVRSSFFLIIFFIFSISYFAVSSSAQTFENYQPPEIACQAPGAWAAVDRNGKGIKQNGRVQFSICTCDVCGPGAASKFNNIPDKDPNSYRHVFANPEQVGLPGNDPTYSFETGLWTTSEGQFKDGLKVAGSGMPPMGNHSGMPPMGNSSGMPPTGQCINVNNPEPGKANVVPAPCGTTFDTYNPPEIACGEDGLEPGVWASVDRRGIAYYPYVSDCSTSAPGGESSAFTPAHIKIVFINPKDPAPSTEKLSPSTIRLRSSISLRSDSIGMERYEKFKNHFTSLDVNASDIEPTDDERSRYDFATGIFTNDQGEQFRDGIPVSGSGSSPGTAPPMGPGTSPAQAELTRATAARQAAEQQLATAQTVLDSATAARQAAEQQLAGAQTALHSARTALQAAFQAVQQEADELAQEEAEKAARLATAEAELQQAEQQLASAETEVASARSALQALQQQLATAQETVSTAENKKNDAFRIVNEAKARVAKIKGGVGDIQDNADDTGTVSGSLPLKPGKRFTPTLLALNNDNGVIVCPDAFRGSIPLQIICRNSTSAQPLRVALLICDNPTDGGECGNKNSMQQPVFAIKIKTGPTYKPNHHTSIALQTNISPVHSFNDKHTTALIDLGLGVGPDETKFYPIKAEGNFVLIRSKDEVDIAEISFIEGCRQPDVTIDRCSGRGPVGGDPVLLEFEEKLRLAQVKCQKAEKKRFDQYCGDLPPGRSDCAMPTVVLKECSELHKLRAEEEARRAAREINNKQ